MASTKRTSSANGRQNIQRSNGDSARWAVGLLLLFVGAYAAAAVFFSYFCWEVDQSFLQQSEEARTTLDLDIANPCGTLGARMGKLLVDSSFGVFGLVIPLIMVILGVRIIRQRPLRLAHTALPLLLIAILGSLTLGQAFDTRWSLCASTGWGGAFGIHVAGELETLIGGLGTAILLLVGWILTGVFINRNFINTVNSAGNAMVDKSGRIIDVVRQKVASGGHAEEEEPEPAPEPAQPAPAPEQAPVDAVAERVATTVERTAPAEELEDPEPMDPEPAPAEERTPSRRRRTVVVDPFVELNANGEPVETLEPSDEPVSPQRGRLVMGAGGLVELEPLADDDPDRPFVELTRTDLEPLQPAGEELPAVDGPASGDGLAKEEQEEQDGDLVVTVVDQQPDLLPESSVQTESYDPLKDLINYRRPAVTLLEDYRSDSTVTDEEITENTLRIEETLKYFGIPIQRIHATVGPTVTLYEIVQAQGVKIAKIQGLQNDIAQSLKAESGIRIIAPIPGKGTIGIEVPNRNKQIVSMYSAIRSPRFQESKAELPVVIGRTIQNESFVFDLAKMPHLLVAGATGQGKSVGLNAIITSLLYRKHPAQLKFVMIDPKMVEFSLYAKIERHFLAKMESEEDAIVTDPKKAVYTLNALCTEMDNRLELCKKAGTRNIIEYNSKFTSRRLNPMNGHRYLPYIVVVIDEFADLIMTAKEVETPVTRLAQKARAIGIHLIIATQRPSVDVITGKIKANFPARIAFRVMQMIDSRTILDRPGADQLIGRGDMLISKDGELTRIQCALVDTPEVERIVDYVASQQGYTEAYALPDYTPESDGGGLGSEEQLAPVKYDALFAEIAREAVASGQISTSMIQRNYEVGFNRAGRIMMQLERAGIVGRQQGAKPRDILFHDSQSLEAKLQDLGVF